MINRVILVGRLTADPELRKTNAGGSVASVRMAVDGASRNQDGSRTTVFLNCNAFNQIADTIAKSARKGSLVYVEGRLNQRSFTRRDGTNATAIEVNIDSFRFLESKNANQSENNVVKADDLQSTAAETTSNETVNLPEDDLPWLD